MSIFCPLLYARRPAGASGRAALLCALCLFCLLFLPARALAATGKRYPCAIRTMGIWDDLAGERLDVAVWYPGGSTQRGSFKIDGKEIQATRNGRPIKGFYPVILLSHDIAGNRFSHHDIATALASAGFIVVAPTHPGDNLNNSSGIFTAKVLYQRPRDLLRALEAVLESRELSQLADESRIGVMGIGMGGLTAMQVAGVTPDFSAMPDICSSAPDDPLCTPWARGRIEKIPGDMEIIEKKLGPSAFSPPLSLFAPNLIAVAPEKELIADMSVKALEAHNTPTMFKNVFGRGDSVDPIPAAPAGNAGTPGDEQAGKSVPPIPPVTLEAFGVSVVILSGKGLYEPVTSWEIVVTDHGEEEKAETDEPPAPVVEQQAPRTGARIYRRPAERRAVRAVSVVAPGGGMFLPQAAMARMTLPVAVVELGRDELYPAEQHSLPYYKDLISSPAKLDFPDSDHYSIFAACPGMTAETLLQGCGRADPDERREMAGKRNEFLIKFFKNVLGEPLEPVAPSNLVAVEPLRPQDDPPQGDKKSAPDSLETPAN